MHLISKAQFATNLWQVSGGNKHKSCGKIKVEVLAVSFINLVFVRL